MLAGIIDDEVPHLLLLPGCRAAPYHLGKRVAGIAAGSAAFSGRRLQKASKEAVAYLTAKHGISFLHQCQWWKALCCNAAASRKKRMDKCGHFRDKL
jgi:hypothetical protein